MRQRLAKWMMGRNGMDALNRLLSVLTLILLIVSMFVHGYAARILWSLAVVGLIVIYFRMLSRNVYRHHPFCKPLSHDRSPFQAAEFDSCILSHVYEKYIKEL